MSVRHLRYDQLRILNDDFTLNSTKLEIEVRRPSVHFLSWYWPLNTRASLGTQQHSCSTKSVGRCISGVSCFIKIVQDDFSNIIWPRLLLAAVTHFALWHANDVRAIVKNASVCGEFASSCRLWILRLTSQTHECDDAHYKKMKVCRVVRLSFRLFTETSISKVYKEGTVFQLMFC